ncbi:hypothetical protein L1049_011247 [Liquidambar formosana]|uniref:Uncharacterized protein n=1 Tax=Liquidambar formosana TaxID=63359 RepID=A0AAP0RRE7_LIQFO
MSLRSTTNPALNQRQEPLLSGISLKRWETEDPATKVYMKAMAAKALCQLAKGNAPICRSIAESGALLCFAVLLEKGPEEVVYNSAMALMEITSVADQDTELRRSALKPNSPACKAVIDQLLKIIDKEDSNLLIPCIKTIGNLARTLRATETRIIGPLVQLLGKLEEVEVSREASKALTKFACIDNQLHIDHSKAIINEGQHCEELDKVEALTVLELASKQGLVDQDETMDILLQKARGRLEFCQSRGSTGSNLWAFNLHNLKSKYVGHSRLDFIFALKNHKIHYWYVGVDLTLDGII